MLPKFLALADSVSGDLVADHLNLRHEIELQRAMVADAVKIYDAIHNSAASPAAKNIAAEILTSKLEAVASLCRDASKVESAIRQQMVPVAFVEWFAETICGIICETLGSGKTDLAELITEKILSISKPSRAFEVYGRGYGLEKDSEGRTSSVGRRESARESVSSGMEAIAGVGS